MVYDATEPLVLARKPRSRNLTVAILTRTPVRPSVARLTVASGSAGGFTGAGSAGAAPSRALPLVTGPHIARQVGDNPFATNRGRASPVTASPVTAGPVTASPTTASRVRVGQVPVRHFRAARGATSGPLGTHFSGSGVSTLPIGRSGLPGAILRTPGPAGPGRATITGFGTANQPLANIEIAEPPRLITAAPGGSAVRAKALRAPSRPADLGRQRAAPLAPGARRPMPKAGGAAISNDAFPSVAWSAVLTPHPLGGGLLRSPGPPTRPPASARSSPPAIAMEASGDTAVRLTSERKTVPQETVPQETALRRSVPLKTSALLPTGRRGPPPDVRSYGRPGGTVPFVMPRGTLAWLPLRKSATREGRPDVAAGRTSPVGATGLPSSSFSLSPTQTGLKISSAAPARERVAASGLLRTTKPVHPVSQPAPVMKPLVMQLARYHQRLAKPSAGASISGTSFSGTAFSGAAGVGTDVASRRGPGAGVRGAKEGGQSPVLTRLQRHLTSGAPAGPPPPWPRRCHVPAGVPVQCSKLRQRGESRRCFPRWRVGRPFSAVRPHRSPDNPSAPASCIRGTLGRSRQAGVMSLVDGAPVVGLPANHPRLPLTAPRTGAG